MGDKEFVLDVLWNDFLCVTKVNVITGEFSELKKNVGIKNYTDFYEYLESRDNVSDVFSVDLVDYEYFFSRANLLSSISKSTHNTFFYRRKVNDVFKWICAEILKPESFSIQNPYVFFFRKFADENLCTIRSAMLDLSGDFHKIISVNLSDDTYSIIKTKKDENPVTEEAKRSFSSWLSESVSLERIYTDDVDVFSRMTNLMYMQRFFLEEKGNLRIRYRRMCEGQWRWVVFEAIPDVDFSPENQSVRIYIRDINEEYSEQFQKEKKMEQICYEDALTGLKNRMSYKTILEETSMLKDGSFGVIYADLNNLKYINDSCGHEAGDRYIKTFSDFLRKSFRNSSCYRIGGDEFVVLLHHMSKIDFEKRVYLFEKSTLDNDDISVSIGSSWAMLPADLSSVINQAEKEMYMVKKEFHRAYPQQVRSPSVHSFQPVL